jgi:uracil-DNA glycosylase
MRPASCLQCATFPCAGVNHEGFVVPDVDLQPALVSIMMIAEAAPRQRSDYFYAGADAMFACTTLLAFANAGAEAASIEDLLARGIYFTTAVKCGKTGYEVAPATIERCSGLLERELALFPNLKALMLMGDVAIRGFNCVARRRGLPRPVPAGATYKVRSGTHYYGSTRVFPSYLQAGPSFFIEKSKQQMIAQDIAAALTVAFG